MSGNLVPTIPMAQPMDRDAEIDQIERELKILRSRYALYRRMGGVLKFFFVLCIPAFAIGASVLAITLRELSGVFLLCSFLGFVFDLAVILLIAFSGLRWIDFASQSPRGIYSPYFFHPDTDVRQRARSEAELIEWQIADRERRLSELKESVLRSDKID